MSRWHRNEWDLLPDAAFQPRLKTPFGSSMTLEGGKGGKAPDPNPGMIASAQASERVGMRALDLQDEYMNFMRQQYEDLKPTLERITNKELEIADANQQRANEYAEYERTTFRPLEKKLVADAEAYSTQAKQDQLSSQAAADVNTGYATARDQNNRSLTRMGINPNSGRFAALNNQLAVRQAADSAGAMTRARDQAEQLGFARRMDVTSLGRGLAPNASTAYGVALTANNQGGNSAAAGANFMGNAYGQGSNMLGQATNAYGTAGNIYSQDFNARMQGYNARQQSSSSFWSGIGQAAGRIGAAYMTGGASLAVPGGRADGGEIRGLRMSDGGVHEGAGPVDGPGGPVDDKVPAMLSDGEYVLPADTVKKIGVKNLDRLVKSTHTPAAIQRKRTALKGKK